jgi:CBS domain-containing protein
MGTDEHSFPVVDNGQLAGLVCLEDVRKVPKEEWDTTTVSQIMTPADKLDMVSPREDATEAFNKLAQRDINQMPVVQNGQVVGMLRRRDILRWLQMQSSFTST